MSAQRAADCLSAVAFFDTSPAAVPIGNLSGSTSRSSEQQTVRAIDEGERALNALRGGVDRTRTAACAALQNPPVAVFNGRSQARGASALARTRERGLTTGSRAELLLARRPRSQQAALSRVNVERPKNFATSQIEGAARSHCQVATSEHRRVAG